MPDFRHAYRGNDGASTDSDGIERFSVRDDRVDRALKEVRQATNAWSSRDFMTMAGHARAAIEILRTYPGPDDVQVVNMLTTLVEMQTYAPEQLASCGIMKRGAGVAYWSLSDKDPDLAFALIRLGSTMRQAGALEDAVPPLQLA